MELLGNVGEVEARFRPFGDAVNLGVRLVHGLHRMYHEHKKSFWPHQRNLLGDVGQMEACSGPFGDSVNLNAR
jgi:hypothetical protein